MNHSKRYCTLEEINSVLDYLKEDKRHIFYRQKEHNENFGLNVYLYQTKTELHLSFRDCGKSCEYIFDLSTGDTVIEHLTGSQAYGLLKMKANIEEVTDEYREKYHIEDWYTSAANIYYNPKYNKTRNTAFEYDVNSMFAYCMTKPMPILSTIRMHDVPREGEIGFKLIGDKLVMVDKPEYCWYVFKTEINQGFIEFANWFYEKKRTAKTFAERTKYKQILNYAVGMLQHHNLFIRAAIIGYSNIFIGSLIDSDTLYSNTDSIVSLKPRSLDIGDGLGQFKTEYVSTPFAYRDSTYQWGNEEPVYRGVPKVYFTRFKELYGRTFDVLVDDAPGSLNWYRYNVFTEKVEVDPLWENIKTQEDLQSLKA